MAEKTAKTRTQTAGAALAERMAGLAAVPEPKPAAAPERKRAPRQSRQASAPMPAEQPKPPLFEKRFTLPLTPDQWGALTDARRGDGVEGTWRIRAMITLWLEDPKIRARVDKLAKEDADRDKRARGYRR